MLFLQYVLTMEIDCQLEDDGFTTQMQEDKAHLEQLINDLNDYIPEEIQ